MDTNHDRISAARKGENAERIPMGLTYLLTSFRILQQE